MSLSMESEGTFQSLKNVLGSLQLDPIAPLTVAATTMGSWKNEAGRHADGGLSSIAVTLKPLFVILACPWFAIFFWVAGKNMGGSIYALVPLFIREGILETLISNLPPVAEVFDQWKILGAFVAFQVICVLYLPGPKFQGPITPSGARVFYTHNGTLCFFVTMGAYFFLSMTGLYEYGSTYRRMGAMLVFLNIAALLLCSFLYLKGMFWPSGVDVDRSGNLVVDYYWGTELHPRIGSFDIKTFVVTRFGMIGWAILIMDFAAEQYRVTGSISDSMWVSVILQIIYIIKFFIWETGYYCSMDIQHDRAGFYLIWGCMVWLPTVYTAPTYYLTEHPINLGTPLATFYLLFGLLCTYINWDSDRQRVTFRTTNGQAKIWGKTPDMIKAEYTTDDGTVKTSLLLVAGYWALSRHFHYLPEILAALMWSIPAGFDHLLPYTYCIYLSCLLFDRAFRDEARCSNKYGKYWKTYCQRVPYRIIPYVF